MAAIEVTGLRKVYGRIAAVDGLDLTVGDGEVVALLGPNGAGRTLRHASAAMSEALAPGAASELPLGHLAALLAWTLAGAVVLRCRFGWEPRRPDVGRT